jgi:RHS repeat-associated protein
MKLTELGDVPPFAPREDAGWRLASVAPATGAHPERVRRGEDADTAAPHEGDGPSMLRTPQQGAAEPEVDREGRGFEGRRLARVESQHERSKQQSYPVEVVLVTRTGIPRRSSAAWEAGRGFEVEPVLVTGTGAPTAGSPATRQAALTFLHADHLGTTRLATRADGTVAFKSASMPFGDAVGPPANEAPSLFAGHARTPESRAVYMMARYYSPALGRFLSPDPLLTGNRFSYVGNNPMGFADPLGLMMQPKADDNRFDRNDEFHQMFEETNAAGVAKAREELAEENQQAETERGERTVDDDGLGGDDVAAEREAIADAAEDHIGETKYAFDTEYGPYRAGENKCGVLVRDVLNEASVGAAYYPSDGSGIQWSVTANDWANPNFNIPGFEVVSSPERGDVVAIPRDDDQGHAGVVTEGGSTPQAVSAGKFSVREDSYFWLDRAVTGAAGPPVYRRWMGTGG